MLYFSKVSRLEDSTMKKIKIRHFGGKRICATWDEVVKTLEQIVVGSNQLYQFFFVFPPPQGAGITWSFPPEEHKSELGDKFLLVTEHTMFPYLMVLVCGNYVHVYCVPNEAGGGLLAFSGDTPTNLRPDDISIFFINTPTEEI